jgi:hypothetical protein
MLVIITFLVSVSRLRQFVKAISFGMVNSTLASEAQLFAKRLRQAMLNAGLKASPTVLAQEFNLRYWGKSISVHAARNWLLGKSLPMQDKLVVLADCLKVNVSELRFGVSTLPAFGLASEQMIESNMQDREMFTVFLKLHASKQHLVRELIYALSLKPLCEQVS